MGRHYHLRFGHFSCDDDFWASLGRKSLGSVSMCWGHVRGRNWGRANW